MDALQKQLQSVVHPSTSASVVVAEDEDAADELFLFNLSLYLTGTGTEKSDRIDGTGSTEPDIRLRLRVESSTREHVNRLSTQGNM